MTDIHYIHDIRHKYSTSWMTFIWYLPLSFRRSGQGCCSPKQTGVFWNYDKFHYNEGKFPTESGTIQFHSAAQQPYNDVWILWKYYETNMISIQSSSLEGTLDPWTAYKYITQQKMWSHLHTTTFKKFI